MLLVPVLSSHLRAMGYDETTGELQIQFWNGTIYAYYGVPMDIYQAFAMSPSLGTFFHQYIRNRPDLYNPVRIL